MRALKDDRAMFYLVRFSIYISLLYSSALYGHSNQDGHVFATRNSGTRLGYNRLNSNFRSRNVSNSNIGQQVPRFVAKGA